MLKHTSSLSLGWTEYIRDLGLYTVSWGLKKWSNLYTLWSYETVNVGPHKQGLRQIYFVNTRTHGYKHYQLFTLTFTPGVNEELLMHPIPELHQDRNQTQTQRNIKDFIQDHGSEPGPDTWLHRQSFSYWTTGYYSNIWSSRLETQKLDVRHFKDSKILYRNILYLYFIQHFNTI